MLRIVSVVMLCAVTISVVGSRNPAATTPVAASAVHVQPQGIPLTPLAAAKVLDAPLGKEIGTVVPGVVLSPIARDRGWVRVRVEGWVREDQLQPADSTLRSSPSAADVRADPVGMRGKLIHWEMEFISLQRADPLRRDMTPDERYILARGPGSENAIVYLVVPEALRSTAESLAPLSRIVVTGKVRVARSEPVGVPILDLEALRKK